MSERVGEREGEREGVWEREMVWERVGEKITRAQTCMPPRLWSHENQVT